MAIASLVAEEITTAIFSDQKYLDDKDVSTAQYDLATVQQAVDLNLPKLIWCNDATLNVVIAAKSSALPEAIDLSKKVASQYADVSLKMVVFTGKELPLAEGTNLVRAKLPLYLETISLLHRPVSEKGGVHLYTWIVDAPQNIRNNPFAGTPARCIVQLLPPGQDPLKLYALMAKQDDKVAVCINSKFLNDVLAELGLDTSLTAISPGPHLTQTSWVIFRESLVSQDKLQAAESKFYNKENYARVPFRTYSGDLTDCECVAEVWVIKKSQTHESLTKFWVVLDFHLCKILALFQHHPRAQYMNTSKIGLGFKTKADAQIFIDKGLPHLKDLGYALKTEGTRDAYWDRQGTSSSSASVRSSVSWSIKGTSVIAVSHQFSSG